MYKHNQVFEQPKCLICHQPIYKKVSISTLINPHCICIDCIKQFKIINEKTQLSSYPLTILYDYNEFYRGLLYRYKGLYDYPLKDVFIWQIKESSFHYFKEYIVVVAPSNEEDNLKRGFSPMKEIASSLQLNVFDGIYKKVSYKQSDLSYKERLDVQSKLGIRNGELLRGKNVLILDDVMTTGSTLKACISLVEKYQPNKIEILALSRVNHEKQ